MSTLLIILLIVVVVVVIMLMNNKKEKFKMTKNIKKIIIKLKNKFRKF